LNPSPNRSINRTSKKLRLLCSLRAARWAQVMSSGEVLCAQESTYEGKLVGLEKIMDPLLVKRDPEIMSGALCFAGTRVPVKNLFDYLEGSSSLEEFLEDFPSVTRARAVAVLEAARERLAVDAPAA
jgi:uncharacterized protein (DUF433 family)